MRVYEPLASLSKVYPPDLESEFEVQASLYGRLRSDRFNVKGNVGVLTGQKEVGVVFDLVIFKNKKAIAIIETKSKTVGTNIRFEESHQAMKYRVFGIPVVLFWDMREYDELRKFLRGEEFKQTSEPEENRNLGSLKRLHKSLDIASMSAYDLGLKELEKDLDSKKESVTKMIEEAR